MGNTIRREPVNFDIPDSPNYKFLNITNFRGLDVSSNPFEMATNTASDCLNVYVDETNTLTTRPRLQKKYEDLLDKLPSGYVPIDVYPLHNGYLLHGLANDLGVMKLFNGSTLTDITGTIPTTKCKYFEQSDSIYLLDGNRYMVIKDNILSAVEGYVPIKTILTSTGQEKDVEPLNALADKYKKCIFWNGVDKIDTDSSVDITDNSYVEKKLITENGVNVLSSFQLEVMYDDNTMIGVRGSTKLVYVDFNDEFAKMIEIDSPVSGLRFSKKHKSFWKLTSSEASYTYQYYYYDKTNNSWKKDNSVSFQMSSNGKVYASDYGEYLLITGDSPKLIHRTDVNKYSTTVLENYSIGVTDAKVIFTEAKDGSLILYNIYKSGDNKFDIQQYNNTTRTINPLTSTEFTTITTFKITDSLNNIYFTGQVDNGSTTDNPSNLAILPVGTNISNYKKQSFMSILNSDDFTLSDDLKYGYLNNNAQTSTFTTTMRITVIPDITQYKNNYTLNKYIFSGMKMFVKLKKYIFVNTVQDIISAKMYLWNDDVLKPNVTITYSTKNDADWKKHNESLLQSKLFTRFDNNYWLANGNRYYRSANNDPTYFPITEYNDLGDGNEKITGFNLANDTTLIAYKPNRVYLIQPFTSSLDTREYTITESKNTVGNTAFDAPLITTLTEIPLQINYDGIYGLSQVSNVSAVERIADLMSEPINDRWLNEDDDVIKKAQTLNRLYWTYIILPYDTSSKIDPRDITKIYLLDNRTNSWYYWELPIKLLSAFVVDNRAEFVDTKGNIYYLTTTDIRNKNFNTQLITEYYDDGRKLIPWFWESQILYLGTMNYSKRLVNTTFILTDTDTQDGYGLNYSFKVFRKLASSTPEKEISNELNLVRSTTKKTNISKFGFIQMRISNITEQSQGTEADKAYRNNKLRLVGLGLKYVLLEGLIR